MGSSDFGNGLRAFSRIAIFIAAFIPAGAINRLEQAGTPVAFSGLRVVNSPGEHQLNLRGEITLAPTSNGLKPGAERVVVVLGTQVAVLEPGALRSSGDDRHANNGEDADQEWHYQDERAPLLRKLILQKHGALTWQLELGLAGRGAPGESDHEDLARPSVRDAKALVAGPRLYLRVGNDWGGLDLGTGQALLTFTPALDPAHSTQAAIGPAGGTLQITDATGAIISLKVPAGALRQTVNLSMTALASSPEVIDAGAVTPGIQFQPEGLHFLIPATLTYDFHATTTALPTAPRLFLLTSPMTMVPLYGSVDLVKRTMTAMLFHFSNDQAAAGNTAASDITLWVNALLAGSGGTLTVEEMASLLAAEDTQQQQGCSAGCIDTGAVAQAIATAVSAQVAASCPADVANPFLVALQNYLQMDAFLQQAGASVPALRACEHNVLGALIAQASTDPGAPDTDLTNYISGNATLKYLAQLLALAQQLGFGDLDTTALQKLDMAFRTAAQNLVTAIQARQSDTNIQAETQQAISDLTQEQQTGDSEGLASVDPAFDAFIQQAIASLSSKVTFKASSINGQLCNGIAGFGGGITFNPPVSLPVSGSDSGCGGHLTLSAKQIGSNEVEFDASGQEGTIPITPTGPTASLFTGTVYLEMQLSSPATVQLELNTQWATNAPVLTLGTTSFDLGGQVAVIGGSAFGSILYHFGLQTFDGQTPINLPAGTYTVFANVYSGTQLASAGAGWLARVTVH